MCPAESSISSFDRRALLLGALALLGGCGFRPLHAPEAAPGAAGTFPVRVALIPERNGQILRQELQRRFGAADRSAYELRVALSSTGEALGFRRDGAASRVRVIHTAEWRLMTAASPVREVGSGTERVLDAFNLADEQFFASESFRVAADRRMMELLAQQVAERVALRLAAV
jgi:LPS-assembly lipoprotein